MSISPSPTAVSYGPRWNSSIVTTRSPASAADDAAGVERRADRGQVLGRVGLAQRAAERAAVAHDRVGDHPLGVAEDRERGGQLGGLQQLAVPGHRADPDLGRARRVM